MTDTEFLDEYARLAHAVQTGVAYEHEYGSQSGTPKHLRTGLSCVMADVGSLARLLIKKGVITDDEYFDTILHGLRQEVANYEESLNARMGSATKITLK